VVVVIAWDLETDLISRPVAFPAPVCISYCSYERTGLEKIEAAEGVIEEILADHCVGQNISFDMGCLLAHDPELAKSIFAAYREGRVEDTMLNQQLLDIASGQHNFRSKRGYDLGTIAERYELGADKDDPWRMRYASLRSIPLENWPEEAKQYAINDAVTTYNVAQKQHELDEVWFKRTGSRILDQAPARARFALALHLTGAHGLRTNPARVEALRVANDTRLAKLKAELAPHGLVRQDGSCDTKAAMERMVRAWAAKGEEIMLTKTAKEKWKVETLPWTALEARCWKPNKKTGVLKFRLEYVSCDRDATILSGDEVMVSYSEYVRFRTLVSRIEDLAKGYELPLQPRYNSLKETGRSSASKGRAKNPQPRDLVGCQIQNFPRGKGPRECLEPRPGNVFVLADYEAAELHSLAQVCFKLFGYSKLGELLNEGVDIHTWFGYQAFGPAGMTYEQALALVKAGDKAAKAWRQAAKAIVYGVPGGMGAKKLVLTARKSYGVKLEEDEAKRLKDLLLALIPELREYFKWVLLQLGDRKTGTTHHPITGFWRGGATYSALANHQFQHLTAQGALSALFEVVRECYSCEDSPLYGFRPVAFCHDEIILEGPRERAHGACMRLSEIMEREMNVWTPDFPTPAEPVATEIWSKDAKAVKTAEGQYGVWAPKKAA
jgi:hypothetical protein